MRHSRRSGKRFKPWTWPKADVYFEVSFVELRGSISSAVGIRMGKPGQDRSGDKSRGLAASLGQGRRIPPC
ncbi:MAG: hypothetical protein DLM68_17715 [Hyphomicrobiales bacterium]|nr:MAG: hypothetical protein DLM68_17715 [Hyphomicrobiales bacterium]